MQNVEHLKNGLQMILIHYHLNLIFYSASVGIQYFALDSVLMMLDAHLIHQMTAFLVSSLYVLNQLLRTYVVHVMEIFQEIHGYDSLDVDNIHFHECIQYSYCYLQCLTLHSKKKLVFVYKHKYAKTKNKISIYKKKQRFFARFNFISMQTQLTLQSHKQQKKTHTFVG